MELLIRDQKPINQFSDKQVFLISDPVMSFLGANLANLHIPSIGGIKKQFSKVMPDCTAVRRSVRGGRRRKPSMFLSAREILFALLYSFIVSIQANCS